MANYIYTTEVIKNGKPIAYSSYSSLAKQTNDACRLVSSVLTNEEFPFAYITATIQSFTRALRKKNVCKEKFYQSFHYDYDLELKMTRKAI